MLHLHNLTGLLNISLIHHNTMGYIYYPYLKYNLIYVYSNLHQKKQFSSYAINKIKFFLLIKFLINIKKFKNKIKSQVIFLNKYQY